MYLGEVGAGCYCLFINTENTKTHTQIEPNLSLEGHHNLMFQLEDYKYEGD